MAAATVPVALIRKWTKIFHYRDVDRDGIVRESDFQQYTERFVSLYGTKAEPVREVSKILWGTMTAKHYQPQVILSEFLENYSYLWTYDRKGLEDKLTRYASLCFDAIDTSGDGKISLEEYAVYQNSFGITNHDYIEHIFNQIDVDGSGFIDKEEFIKEVVEFATFNGPEKIPDMYDHYKAQHFKKKTNYTCCF